MQPDAWQRGDAYLRTLFIQGGPARQRSIGSVSYAMISAPTFPRPTKKFGDLDYADAFTSTGRTALD